ncbi:hypothetical protein HK103_000669 [Boothiomyces macroporosus]|uniref:Uncharacterized protein n=1 Tax=Boothiomyces macroporosus TaxID=261099 RepID=A0AAD5UN63_9FUNG|nr:hypothetical protein HK103_000669 [Boothiomyces macroporosus]
MGTDILTRFIHLSTKEQANMVANRYFSNESQIIVLLIRPDLPAVKWEPPVSPNKDFQEQETREAEKNKELFPHCYSAIDLLSDVEQVLTINKDGEFKI